MARVIFSTDLNKVGMRWFEPLNNAEFKIGVFCKGIGEEKYAEGSVYIGEMEYDGKNFYKQGHGRQYFAQSTFSEGTAFGGPEGSVTLLYEGDFDHSKSDWFYGNGIFYFTRRDGTPLAIAHKFFKGVGYYEDWKGNFNENRLFPGFTADMNVELTNPFSHKFKEYIKEYSQKNFPQYEFVFFGDSWMDYWRNHNNVYPPLYGSEFEQDKGEMSAVNVGVAGTKFSDWDNDVLDNLVLKFNGDVYVINLGFNDLHFGYEVKEVLKECIRVINKILTFNKKSKIYLCSLTHCTPFTDYWKRESELNGEFKKLSKKIPNVKYLSTGELFLNKNGEPIKNMDDYCIADRLHLNRKGYDVWAKFILDSVK